MRARSVLVAVSLLAGATACDGENRATPVIAAAPDTLVLRVQEWDSGIPPWEKGRLPAFSLYGEGWVVVAGDPAGALQQAREFQLPAEEYERLVVDAGAAGLGQARDYEETASTDASLLKVSLRTADGLQATRIAAPEARTWLPGMVVNYVQRLPRAPRGTREFQPTALAVLATGGVSDGPTTAWPLHPLTEGVRTYEGMCTVVTGDELATVTRLAADAQQQTRWSSGGSLYTVSFRPLLPDERTCADIDVP
jgi:hypothetical protein